MTRPAYTKPAGDVSRWHAHPCDALRLSGDTINKHQKRCGEWVRKVFALPPDSLIQAAEHHDEPERWLGDTPFPAKRDYRNLALEYAAAESEVIMIHGIPQPANDWEHAAVKLVDMIDAYWWMQGCAPHLATSPEWIKSRDDIEAMASRLYVTEAVARIIGPP